MHKEELIKFWKSASASGSRNFLKNSSTLRDRAFSHNLAHISGESDRILMKIFITDVSLDKEIPVKFWKSVSGCGLCGSRPHSQADTCGLWLLLWTCVISAGQETAKQALQEIVILPALRPEVRSSCKAVIAIIQHDYDISIALQVSFGNANNFHFLFFHGNLVVMGIGTVKWEETLCRVVNWPSIKLCSSELCCRHVCVCCVACNIACVHVVYG